MPDELHEPDVEVYVQQRQENGNINIQNTQQKQTNASIEVQDSGDELTDDTGSVNKLIYSVIRTELFTP